MGNIAHNIDLQVPFGTLGICRHEDSWSYLSDMLGLARGCFYLFDTLELARVLVLLI